MDYDIKVETLSSKSNEFETLKSSIEDIYNEFNSCSINKTYDSELNSIKTSLKESINRLKKGYTNSNNWLKKYVKEITELESNLAAFNVAGLTTPTEFKGEFIDLFGKKTMPIIKTGGDIHANASIGVKLSGNTNQDKIFNYLKGKGFNEAAICGILANIKAESSFRTDALGDDETSYGICQWHDSRWTRLKNYCNENNLDWRALDGQLEYLIWELQAKYPTVYNKLKSVPNTKQGAYDAAYVWTTDFEIPADKYGAAQRRGKSSESYWNTYSV